MRKNGFDNRLSFRESLEEYIKRHDVSCRCPKKPKTDFDHHLACEVRIAYIYWREYVEQIFPDRVCVDMPSNIHKLKLDRL